MKEQLDYSNRGGGMGTGLSSQRKCRDVVSFIARNRASVSSRCQCNARYCFIGVLVCLHECIPHPGLNTLREYPAPLKSADWLATMCSPCFPTCRKLRIVQHPHFPTDSATGKLDRAILHVSQIAASLSHAPSFKSEIEIIFRVLGPGTLH